MGTPDWILTRSSEIHAAVKSLESNGEVRIHPVTAALIAPTHPLDRHDRSDPDEPRALDPCSSIRYAIAISKRSVRRFAV